MPPKGIAEYFVVDTAFPEVAIQVYFQEQGLREFEVIKRTPFHILYRRKAIEVEAANDRDRFTRIFGPESIGGVVEFPRVQQSPSILWFITLLAKRQTI